MRSLISLGTCNIQASENMYFLGTWRLGYKIERGPHARQHPGINRIRLIPSQTTLIHPNPPQRRAFLLPNAGQKEPSHDDKL